MNVVGIVAEYNPFHNGHAYHIGQAKKITRSECALVLMSPNFVQRGAPALINKWDRTRMALLGGADLVIELPTIYAASSAEFFSHASISLLDQSKIVNRLCFGGESNHIALLTQVAEILSNEPKGYKELLKSQLDLGQSFPAARAKALEIYCKNPEINRLIKSPNNILGIEYLKALQKLDSPMVPYVLERKGAGYHDPHLTGEMASATAIRKAISQGLKEKLPALMPKSSYDLLYGQSAQEKFLELKDLSAYLSYRLLFSSPEDLRGIIGIREGLENRILRVFGETQKIEEMIPLIKSKRFTQTAIQRILLNIILHLEKEDLNHFQEAGGPQYIRVLGFKKSSDHLLARLKENSSLPLVMNLSKDYQNLPPLGQKMLDLEIRSTNIYSSASSSFNNQNLDYTHPLVIL